MSEANGSAELIFEFTPNGKASGMTVTARLGDDVLHVDRFDVAKAGPRDKFLDSIVKGRPGINRADVERVLLARAAEYAARQAKVDDEPNQPQSADLLAKMPDHVRAEARAMLEAPDLLKRVIADVAACGVAGEKELVSTIYLLGVSRMLAKPLAAVVMAPSSVGKSFTVRKVSELFPPEAVIHATSMTPQALFYMPPGSLTHRWIVAGERSRKEDDDTAEATRALREMISEGRLSKWIPVKVNNQIVTQKIEQDGPISFIETTTLSRIFDEDANRCLLLAADERPEQTRAVMRRLAANYGATSKTCTKAVVDRHHALQRTLRRVLIYVPFAEQIADAFPDDRVEARRAYSHFMGVVQALALLHQFQRKVDSDGRIIANADDYQVARRLTRGPLARLLGGRIGDAALRFYDRLEKWATDQFSTTEAVKKDRKSKQAVASWIRELADVGAIEQITEAKGSRPAVWKLTKIDRDELTAGDCGLPENV